MKEPLPENIDGVMTNWNHGLVLSSAVGLTMFSLIVGSR